MTLMRAIGKMLFGIGIVLSIIGLQETTIDIAKSFAIIMGGILIVGGAFFSEAPL